MHVNRIIHQYNISTMKQYITMIDELLIEKLDEAEEYEFETLAYDMQQLFFGGFIISWFGFIEQKMFSICDELLYTVKCFKIMPLGGMPFPSLRGDEHVF